jgi:hypothetical protein
MSKKSGQMEPQTKEPKKKEGLQPLTVENVKEFHEEEESWEDPKDFGIFHLPPQAPLFQTLSSHWVQCLNTPLRPIPLSS